MIKHRARLGFVQVGQNLFPDPKPHVNLGDLGNGRQAVPGYCASIKATMSSLSLSFKDKTGAFYKPGS